MTKEKLINAALNSTKLKVFEIGDLGLEFKPCILDAVIDLEAEGVNVFDGQSLSKMSNLVSIGWALLTDADKSILKEKERFQSLIGKDMETFNSYVDFITGILTESGPSSEKKDKPKRKKKAK